MKNPLHAVLVGVTIGDRRMTVFVDFGDPASSPRRPCVRFGDVWLPVKSCRDGFGREYVAELGDETLLEIAAQISGAT